MKLVIDINDRIYGMIKDGLFFIKGGRGRPMEYDALKAIFDGKPLSSIHDDIKAEIEENIQDCQLPQGHDLWWNGRKDGLIDALVIINEHIGKESE